MTIQTITPELVPHYLFHRGSWLLPEEYPQWYYFMAKENAHKIMNKKFDDSVDEPLAEMVKFLHKRGIITTASCSGHHEDKYAFQKIYYGLEKDQYRIKENGLLLKDIESGNKIFYHDAFYKLPWTGKTFVEKAVEYQQHGVIGFVLDKNLYDPEKIMSIRIPGMEYKIDNGILIAQMQPHASYSNEERWAIFTKELKRAIKAS